MRCITCRSLSFFAICKRCQETFLKPGFTKRVLDNDLNVYSFYKYEEIKDLLHTKHHQMGYFVFKILANNSLALFAKNFQFEGFVYAVGIDDTSKYDGYSHTAILAKSLKSKHITPLFGKLRASNRISYSGKSLNFRKSNPRGFAFRCDRSLDVILVDDIITTGLTLKEAANKVAKQGSTVLFALTLADAKS